MVNEHLANLHNLLSEARKIIKGVFLISTANLAPWLYEIFNARFTTCSI
jgi:2-polyprenyl-3-methyl-5-hydroxy-6-metoxy-1,4-benzoquinol methylase